MDTHNVILFLDFDGVINSTEFNNEFGTGDILSPTMIARVCRILKTCDAKVVISSTWKCYHTLPYLVSRLEQAGFVGEVIGITPNLENSTYGRGDEINAWLAKHPEVKAFVILDDYEHDFKNHPNLIDKFVKTNEHIGMEPMHVTQAISVLLDQLK